MKLTKYTKAIIQAATPLVVALGLYMQTGMINGPEASLALTGLVGAVLVYAFRNRPRGWARFAKFFASLLTPLFTSLLVSVTSGAWNQAETINLAVGIITSLLVYISTNVEVETKPRRPRRA